MKIVEPSIEVTFYAPEDGKTPEESIEVAARTCYKSEDKITDVSAERLIRLLLKRGHHAMLEFGYATAKIVGDRGLTHELVRHRLASFAQESTRYCNYGEGKFGSEITIIEIPGITDPSQALLDYYHESCAIAEERYFGMIAHGAKPEIARMVLPIGLKAEITIGANLREWRHIFEMRCERHAHPIIRGVMTQALQQFADKMPTLYSDQVARLL